MSAEIALVLASLVLASCSTGGATAGSQPMSLSHPAQLGGHVDYYGITMAPDGTPWVGFYQACVNGRPVPGNPNTKLAGGRPTDALFAMVGHMKRTTR